MWQKIWAACFKSATMAVHYVVFVLALAFANLDRIAAVVNDPAIVQQLKSWLADHPLFLGFVIAAISVITMLARMRTIFKAR